MSRGAMAAPIRIELSPERRERLVDEIRGLFSGEFEHDLSEFQAERLVDFLLRHLGAPIYNQAIQDARGALQQKLDDLEGEFYEPLPEEG